MDNEQTVKNELEGMFDFLEEKGSEEKVNDDKTDSDKTQEEESKDEVVEEEGEEKEVDDAGEEELEEEEEEEEDEEEKGKEEEKEDEKEKAMLQAIADLKEEIRKLKEPEKKKEEKKKEEKEVYEFIKEDKEFDEIINDRTKFNAVLSKIYHAAKESIISSIPSVVTRTVQEQVATGTAMNRFLTENKDLFEENVPAGKDPNEIKMKRWGWLQKKMTELQTEDPSLATDPYKLISKAGEELRDLIGNIKSKKKENKTIERPVEKKRRPFPGKSGVRSEKGAEKRTDAASIFEELAPFVTQ